MPDQKPVTLNVYYRNLEILKAVKTFKKGTGLTGSLIEHGWVLGSEGSHLKSNNVWAGNSHTATLWK